MTRRYVPVTFVAVASLLVVTTLICASEPKDKAGVPQEMKMTLQQFEKVEVLEFDWRWIRWLMNSKIDPKAEMTLGVVYIKPNQVHPMHLHPNSGEYLHVTEGSCEHWVGDKWVTMEAGDTIRIPKNAPHRARTKDEGCRCVIVYNTGDRKMVTLDD